MYRVNCKLIRSYNLGSSLPRALLPVRTHNKAILSIHGVYLGDTSLKSKQALLTQYSIPQL